MGVASDRCQGYIQGSSCRLCFIHSDQTSLLFFTCASMYSVGRPRTKTPPPHRNSMTKDDDKKGKQLSIEPKKSDKYYDEKGDLEIVSSDGVLFKIHAFYLQSSSYGQSRPRLGLFTETDTPRSVFRDMISVGQGVDHNPSSFATRISKQRKY